MARVNGVKGEWQQVTQVEKDQTFRITGVWKADHTGNPLSVGCGDRVVFYINEDDVAEVFVPEDTLAQYKAGTVLLGANYQRAIVRSEQSWHWADDDTDTLSDATVTYYLNEGDYKAIKTPRV